MSGVAGEGDHAGLLEKLALTLVLGAAECVRQPDGGGEDT